MAHSIKGLILAAGLGTRLRPLTAEMAKPALPVLGVPSLWYSAWHFGQELHLPEVAINFSHAPQGLKLATSDKALQKAFPMRFHMSDETSELLGTSGALWKLKDWIGDSTLAAANGDVICFPPWKKMLDFHNAKKAAMTIHLRRFESSGEAYANVVTDKDFRVTTIQEKKKSGTMFTGCYLLDPSSLERLPEGFSDTRKTLLDPLAQEGKLFGYVDDSLWLDTGSVESYAEAQFQMIKNVELARPLVETKMKEASAGVWVPNEWKSLNLKLSAPCLLLGEQKEWKAVATAYGPNFVGIAPPGKKTSQPLAKTTNVLVFNEFKKEI